MRYVRIIGGILGAIVLGAVGSGAWDLLFRPFVFWLWSWSTSVGGFLLSSIRNVPYQDAARTSPHDTILYLAFLLAAFWFGGEMSKVDPVWRMPADATPEDRAKVYQRWRRVARPLTVAIFVFITFQLGQARATYQVADSFQHNVEAIRGFIQPAEAASLRFAFTHMTSRDDYLALTTRMASYAKAAGIELPRQP